MTVTNKTANTIKITGRDFDPTEIKPNKSMDFFSRMFDIISIHSEEGSCIITIAYGERDYEFFGNLNIKENGMKEVEVFSK